ncbi:MAG: efflux RND transporter periplasmic adaptor subunit [Bacteroidota bacterium]|nr:efflux RND transporter periplasmic adaptor subunit [Bacteroidota bacterium]
MITRILIPMLIILDGLALQSCNRSDEARAASGRNISAPQVLNDENEIVFSPNSLQLQQFTIDTVHEETIQTEFTAPAHFAVSIARSEFGNGNVYLFETPDLTQLYADFVKSVSAVERSSKNYRRLEDLTKDKAIAEKELLDAQTDYNQSQADMAQKESQLRAAGIDPKVLEQTAAGTVIVAAEVPEGQLTNIKTNSKVEIECNAYPAERFIGKVSSIGDVIDPTTRTAKVRIILSNLENKLRAGMFGTAHFFGDKKKAVTIPVTGIVREGDGTLTVWVTTDRCRFVQRKVTVGLQRDDEYQILDGLRPGEQMVSRGGVFLSNMLQAPPED